MAPSTKKISLKDKVEDGEIDLSMSDLQEVPIKEIAAIKKVHSLDLSNNHISVLTRNFSTLGHLIKIDLSKNDLRELPDNFGELHKLKHLDLYKNQLQHLPLSFSKLKALRWLDLKDNPLVPAIANVAGPCLETKQCQDCAKNIVTFYTKLETSVEQEKNLREELRLKNIQANMEKAKEKKSKKAKKEKTVPIKESTQIAAETKTSQKPMNVAAKKNRNKKKPKLSPLRFIRLLIVALLVLTVTMFILTAAKIEFMRIFEDKAVEVWFNCVSRLPNNLQGVGLELGKSIKLLHDFTAKGVLTVTSYMSNFGNNHSVNVILTEVSQVFKNVSVTAGKIYVKVFGT